MNRTIILYREKDSYLLNADINVQKQQCKDFAQAKKLEVTQEYVGIPWNEEDTSLLALDSIADIKIAAEKGEFDRLLVYSFYCIGRQDIETPVAIQGLLKRGIQVESVLEGSFM